MKVRELQEQLAKLEPDLEVVCYSEDANLLVEGRGFIVFDVSAVSAIEAERHRLGDGAPYLKMGQSEASEAIAIVEVTSDF